MIDVENIESHATDGRFGSDPRTLPSKMPFPEISTWMIQWRQLSRDWINAGEIRPFLAIAWEACQGEIRCDRDAVMLQGDDVVKS